ncbi:hypothetical protein [Dokdonia sp.]
MVEYRNRRIDLYTHWGVTSTIAFQDNARRVHSFLKESKTL